MIELEKDGDLWIVTINRPDKANSLTAAMLEELADIAEAAQAARGLILTGRGLPPLPCGSGFPAPSRPFRASPSRR